MGVRLRCCLQESSLEVQLTLLYGNTVAIRDELAELRRSVGTSSYQISEELEVRLFFIVLPCAVHSLVGKHQKVHTSRPPESVHLPLQGTRPKGVLNCKQITESLWSHS